MLTGQIRKQLRIGGGRIIKRGKSTRQAGELVVIFTHKTLILLAFGEMANGYPHPCIRYNVSRED
jgi:hypothetical protein